MLEHFKSKLRIAINAKLGFYVDEFSVTHTKIERHGHITTNIAFIIASLKKGSALEVANDCLLCVSEIEGFAFVEIAGGGFLNIWLDQSIFIEILQAINNNTYHIPSISEGESINLEFVSCNPTGPLHVGHSRGAIIFDVLSRLLEMVGYQVTKEYYVNDCGSQIERLSHSVFFRYKEAMGEDIDIPEDCYPGIYLKQIGETLYRECGDDILNMTDEERLDFLKSYSVREILKIITNDLTLLGVKYDVFSFESDLYNNNLFQESLDVLTDKELIFQDTLPTPKGRMKAVSSQESKLVFHSKRFGDSENRSLQKEDGSWSYFAGDIAYHFGKIKRGFVHLIVGLGADHIGYVKRLKSVVAALSDDKVNIDVKIYNLVNFLENGKPVKMSKRRGSFLSIADVVHEVGADVVRFMMLMRKNDVILDFDFNVLKEQSKNNPVFYVQYAYARGHSILRQAPADLPSPRFELIDQDMELVIIKIISKWPDVVKAAAEKLEPHRVVFFLLEVAEAFHSLWHKGKQGNLKFIDPDDREITAVRVELVKGVLNILRAGFHVLNIKPMEYM